MAENKDVKIGDVKLTIQDTVKSLVAECAENQNQGRSKQSIYRAPSALKKLSLVSFKPHVVSIGPLHKDYCITREFETQKAKCVHDLLIRLKPPREETLQQIALEQTLEACVEKVALSIDLIKGCYDEIYGDVELAKMMVMDACFILEFIYQLRSESSSAVNKLRTRSICYDLVLLENQIPFFVLNDMYTCTVLQFFPTLSLVEFILPVLKHVNLFHTNLRVGHEINKSNQPISHILSLLHMYYQPDQPQSNALSFYSCSTTRSAVELDRIGVNFKPNKDEKRPMEVKVKVCRYPWSWGKPEIIMPVMRLNHFTESVLRNLIAYEQSSTEYHYVTSFATTMDMLIDTQEDVALLVRSEVLVNKMGSNKEAANIINKLCKEVACVHSVPNTQWEKLDSYCKSYWPKYIEGFKRTYFNSPWTMIALVAGILLFTLTVIQTFFAINPPGIKE